ncbi:cilia- and flagella-associated protein 144-like isoform 2-T2 [Lycaon pictus]
MASVHTITRKPVSWHQNLEEPADVPQMGPGVETSYHADGDRQVARFLNLIHQAAQGPRKRYPDTQTESPEIGRDSEA